MRGSDGRMRCAAPRPFGSVWLRARLGTAAAALCLFACTQEAPGPPTLSTRVFVDRTELTVGDAVGVTIEIETPQGFTIEAPLPPAPSDHFATESVRGLDPVALPGAMRHRLLWTLRARGVGDERLPLLEVPLVRPGGQTLPLRVGGVPLPVLSVRGEHPEREVYFDIQPPPEPNPVPGWAWGVGGASALAALGLLALALRRRRRGEDGPPSPAELRRDASRALAQALEEADTRALATTLAGVIWSYVEQHLAVPATAHTAHELPEGIDAELVALLVGLERARFQREPVRDDVLRLWRDARAHFRADGEL